MRKSVLTWLGTVLALFWIQPVLGNAFLEVGSSTLTTTIDNGGWVTVTTQRRYLDPVVIAGPVTHNNDNSLSVRVRNVSGGGGTASFQVGMQSPCENTGTFNSNPIPNPNTVCPPGGNWQTETVQWLVVERGTWVFPDGTKIEAYKHDTNAVRASSNTNAGDTIAYSHTYSAAPAVLHTVNTFNDPDWTTTVARSNTANNAPPGTTNFRLALEGAEVDSTHATETIGWVAIERGVGTNRGNRYSAGRTPGLDVDRHSDECQALNYGIAFFGTPNVLTQNNSMSGGNGSWTRFCAANTATQFNVHVDEDQVNDTERTGIPEYVAWFAFQANGFGELRFLDVAKDAEDEDSDGIVGPGELITYTVTITNRQDDFAQTDNPASTEPEFTDDLDSNVDFDSVVSASSGALTYNAGSNRMEWQGSVANSATVTLVYRVRVKREAGICTAASIENQGQANMDPIDNSLEPSDIDSVNVITEVSDDALNNAADSDLDGLTDDDDPTLVTVSCRSDLSITKTDSTATYTPGGSATYVIVVQNAGPDDAYNVTVTDALPNGVTVAGNWTCSATGNASCFAGSAGGTGATGTGDINQAIDVTVGDTVSFSVPVNYSPDMGDY